MFQKKFFFQKTEPGQRIVIPSYRTAFLESKIELMFLSLYQNNVQK